MKKALERLVARFTIGGRPSKDENKARMRARGETLASYTIREAGVADVPAIARVHVVAFNETHTVFGGGPTYELRARQWHDKLSKTDGSFFVFVAVDPVGKAVGYASGKPGGDPVWDAHLDKIYVLREYHRLGIGGRLLCHVARRFVSQGRRAMNLFSQAENPSLAFFDALGGERLLADNGEFHGAFGWRDLTRLVAACPPD